MSNIFYLFQTAAFEPEQLHTMGETFDLLKRAFPERDAYEIARVIITVARRGPFSLAQLSADAMELVREQDGTGGLSTIP